MSLVLLAVLQSALTDRTGVIKSARVLEASGVAVSRAHAGVLWTHNDSGDGPYLYATDLQGTDRGAVRVLGAEAFDWEDIALGPCPTRAGECVFIGDVGDNIEVRPFVTLYAVPEPEPPAAPGDLDGNQKVDGADLAILLGQWSSAGSADLDASGVVDGVDLAIVLGGWTG